MMKSSALPTFSRKGADKARPCLRSLGLKKAIAKAGCLSLIYIYTLCHALILVSCSSDNHSFKIEGRLLNLNQGEFYVYSIDDTTRDIDTIKVVAGRFAYETQCKGETTLMLVFPNYTEHPIFARPGGSVDIKGDAHNMKEMKVSGSDDNKIMSEFRTKTYGASLDDTRKAVRRLARDNKGSRAAAYLVYRWFVACEKPDYASARQLTDDLLTAQKDNRLLNSMKSSLTARRSLGKGDDAPVFTAHDIDGREINERVLKATPIVVAVAWASWNFDSSNMLRRAQQTAEEHDGRVSVLSVCLNPDLWSCRKHLQRNSLTKVTTVCDGKMVEGDLYNRLGMATLPDNVVFKNGKVAATRLTTAELMDFLRKELPAKKAQ